MRGEGRRERQGEAARFTFKFLHRPMNPIPKSSRTRVGRVREIRRDRQAWGGATFDFSPSIFNVGILGDDRAVGLSKKDHRSHNIIYIYIYALENLKSICSKTKPFF